MNHKYCVLDIDRIFAEIPLHISKIVYIEATKKCNLYCIHCFNRSNSKEIMPKFSHFMKILSKLEDIYVKEIIISGGEPFIRPDIMAVIGLFSEKYSVKVLTNGTLLTESDIYSLIKKQIKIQITLNGSTQYIDTQIRGTGFTKTVDSIKKIISLGGENLLIVTTALSKCNYKDVENYVDFLVSLGVKNIQFSMVNKRGRAIDNWSDLELSLPEKVTTLQEIESIKKKYIDINIITSGLSRLNNYLESNSERDCEYYTEEVCFNSDESLSICPRMQVFSECKNIEPEYSSLEQLQIRNFKIDYHKCRKCEAYTYCLVGCLDDE